MFYLINKLRNKKSIIKELITGCNTIGSVFALGAKGCMFKSCHSEY